MNAFQINNSYADSASTTTANIEIIGGNIIRINNIGGEIIFFKFGNRSVETSSDDSAISPGGCELFSRKPGDTHIAIITNVNTSLLSIQTGEGF